MNWQHFYIELPEARMAFISKGTGQKVLLCLHGYRQQKEMFHSVFEEPPSDWTILAVDLPLFGKTEWKDPQHPLSRAFLHRFWQALYLHYPETTFYLLGFSMGGMVTMALQEAAPRPVPIGILIASDGIRSNPWHKLVKHRWGAALLAWANRHHRLILKLNEALYQRRWLNPFTYRFALRNFGEAETRDLLAQHVRLYGPIHTDLDLIVQHSEQHRTKWHLIWGEKDKVLPWQTGLIFQKRLPTTELHLLPAGHLLFRQQPEAIRRLIWQCLPHLQP